MTSLSGPRPSDKLIPYYIVLFFVVQTVLFIGFAYIAKTTYPGVVTDEAYDKGLHYNTIIAKADRQAALGFTSLIKHDGDQIVFDLKDRRGNDVAQAKVKMWLYRPSGEKQDFSAVMTDLGNGHYAAKSLPPQKGLWEIRIHAQTQLGAYQTSQRLVFK